MFSLLPLSILFTLNSLFLAQYTINSISVHLTLSFASSNSPTQSLASHEPILLYLHQLIVYLSCLYWLLFESTSSL